MKTWLRIAPGVTFVAGVAMTFLSVNAGCGDPPTDELGFDAALAKANKFVVVGRVVTADGKTPLQGVELRACSGSYSLYPTGDAKTDKAGRFRLVFEAGVAMAGGKVGGQAAVVSVSKQGWYGGAYGRPAFLILSNEPLSKNEVPRGTSNIVPGRPLPLEFRMKPAASLTVKMLDGGGKPLTNINISLTGEELPPGCNVIEDGMTDADGRFVVRDVPRSMYRLEVRDRAAGRGQLVLGSIDFRDAAEYVAEATIHEWDAQASYVTFKVKRGRNRSND